MAYIVLFVLLLVIFVQDLKFRAVTWIVFPVMLAVSLVISYYANNSWQFSLEYFLYNLTFVAVQLLVVTIYFSIKNGRLINITREYLGLGDVLFLICCTALFSPVNFIIFYLGSIVVVIAFQLLSGLLKPQNPKIPLAGMQAVMLLVLMIVANYITSFDTYNDYWIYSFYG